jgi:amino acid transporter
VLFFIPSALVCAELATGWPRSGGVYRWVSEAFGEKCGFFAIWISWMLSISWFPAVLTFTAAAAAYIFMPELIHHKGYMVCVMLAVFWLATFWNFFGMQVSGWISSIGAILGTIIPGFLIIGLGLLWLFLDKPLKIDMHWHTLIPEFDIANMVFFAGVLLAFAGMEISAYHAREADNPQKDYPPAILISSIIILLISIMGSLSIAFVVSHHEVSLFAGLMQAFSEFFGAFDLLWVVPILGAFALIGSLAGINTWIVGPAKGILASSEDGFLPPLLQKLNKHDMPIGTLFFQAIVGSLLTCVFFFMPNVNSAFWIITALTIQFAMIMYILIFASAIKLRYRQKDVYRSYRIPGKTNMGMWLAAGTGLLICVFGFFICFMPPAQFDTGAIVFYESYLIGGLVLLSLPPFILMRCRKDSWRKVIHI